MKIDVFIIGVEKAGTTALFRHLAQSPYVSTHEQREMFYFLSDYEYKKGWDYALQKYFSNSKDGIVLAKNVMQINSNESMIRLNDQCPDVKCIIMLREPAARAYSAYNYAVLRGAEDCQTFEEALEREFERLHNDPKPNNPLGYLSNSTYSNKVQAALEIFGMNRILVIFHEEYKVRPSMQLQRIENFIGLDLFQSVELDLRAHNKAARARYPWISKYIYRFLQSRNPIKSIFRSIISHGNAVQLRHAILNFNRVESPYLPMSEKTAKSIRSKLEVDRQKLIELVGHCPW